MKKFAILSILAVFSAQAAEEKWIPLFNGKNLDGWTPKFMGHKAGENVNDTFRVEDGVLKVSYDKWDKYGGKHGHLFYKDKLENYRIKIEYRFVGEQCKEGPGWAFRNSGVMLLSESYETMGVDQDFPSSLECQFLGGEQDRTTGDLCTPGTYIKIDGQVKKDHCIYSKSEKYPGDQWVTVEAEVRGADVIHFVNGKEVMRYTESQLDEGDAHAKELIKLANGEKLVKAGWICLQAESHPLEFRKVEIMKLDAK